MAITLSKQTPATLLDYYYSVAVEWDEPEVVDHYRLFYGTSSGLTEASSNIKITKFTTFIKTNLIEGTQYYFMIKSYSNITGAGDVSSTIQEEIDSAMMIVDSSNELTTTTSAILPLPAKDDITEYLLFDTSIEGGYSSGGEPLFLYTNSDPSNSIIYFASAAVPDKNYENYIYDENIPTVPGVPNPLVCREYLYDPDPEEAGGFIIKVNVAPILPPVIMEVVLGAPMGSLVKVYMFDPDNILLPPPLPPNSNFIYPPSDAQAIYPAGRGPYLYLIADPVLGLPIPSPVLPSPKLLFLTIFCRVSDDKCEGNRPISNLIQFVFHPVKEIIGNKLYIRNMQDPSGDDWKVQVVVTEAPPDESSVWVDWDADNDSVTIPATGKFTYSAYARSVKISDDSIKSASSLIVTTSGFVPQ